MPAMTLAPPDWASGRRECLFLSLVSACGRGFNKRGTAFEPLFPARWDEICLRVFAVTVAPAQLRNKAER